MPLPTELKNRYIVLRHGESEANLQGIIVSHPAEGIRNFGLTQKGREEIRRAGRAARLNGIQIDVIYTSPFRRCRESAENFAGEYEFTKKIRVSHKLSERYFGPVLDGGPKVGYTKIYASDRENPYSSYLQFGAETVDHVGKRFGELILEIEGLFEGKTILLVTHADVGEIGQALLEGREPQTHRQYPKLINAELRELTGCLRRNAYVS